MTRYIQENVAKMERPFVAYGLIGLIGISLALYVFFVNAAIFSITTARDTRENIADTMSIVSELETHYANDVASVNTGRALAVGFSTDLSTRYLSESSGLSFNSLGVR